jgi:hypothetical protein
MTAEMAHGKDGGVRMWIRQSFVLLALGVVLAIPVQADEASKEAAVVKKYPPYPDVWRSKDIGKLCKGDNGDFFLVSDPFEKKGTGGSYRRITAVFGQSAVEVSRKEADGVWLDRKPLAGVGTLSCYGINDYPPSLVLRNGFTVRRACLHSRDLCGYPYYPFGLEIRGMEQRVVARGVLLGLLKIPLKRSLPYPQVAEDMAGEIAERVQALQPRLVPLEDETFLVHTMGGTVFRFDKQLRTRFPINEDRLFMIEPSLIEEIYRQTGQSVEPGSLAWHQAVQDAVAELLEKLRKEKRP